jgi:antirestriction protein
MSQDSGDLSDQAYEHGMSLSDEEAEVYIADLRKLGSEHNMAIADRIEQDRQGTPPKEAQNFPVAEDPAVD